MGDSVNLMLNCWSTLVAAKFNENHSAEKSIKLVKIPELHPADSAN